MDSGALRKMLDSDTTCVRVVTFEEPEAVDLVLDVASGLGVSAWVWSPVRGLARAELRKHQAIPDTMNAAAALVWLRMHLREPSMVILLDMADYLDDRQTVRALRELIEFCRAGGENSELQRGAYVVMVDHRADVPSVIDAVSRRFDISPPDDAEIEALVREALRKSNKKRPLSVRISKRTFSAIIQTLRGLSRRQVCQVIHEAVSGDGEFTEADLPEVIQGKRRYISAQGVLDFVDRPVGMEEVGGLSRLKKWVKDREAGFTPEGQQAGLEPARGVLLLGVQGAGKSLAAKAIAAGWQRPLMRLDPGVLYDRYVGESERRLREALRQAETMAPVVLWVDEVEKGFASAASQSTDGGLSQRLFGTLLTWMQDHTAPVFLVATANNIEALPPELLRKGRFDEIFFVDLPGVEAREQILKIHLRKRGQDGAKFDIKALVAASQGYSGSEIEAAIRGALHGAFTKGRAMGTQDVVEELAGSPPLSVTMREKIAELRAWAVGRCVMADEGS